MDYFAIFAVLLAYMVKGLCGFANGLIFSSLMSFRADNINITPLDVILGSPSNIIIAIRERKSLSWKVYLPLSIMVIAGIIPGTLLLKHIDATIIKLVFGFAIIVIAAEMLHREYRKNKDPKPTSRLALGIIGVISGILCGLFGLGAFLVAYVSRTTQNSSEFRANLCMVFFVENTFRIILYSTMGILTIPILKQALVLLPFVFIGLAIGILLSKRISDSATKKIIIILLMLTGLTLIIKNLLLII